jgi:ATP-binding cassette, subfamily B (MDR/TAP), member 1
MSLQHIAEGGGIAEEVISTIRTAQAFGTQHTLAGIYDEHVEMANVLNAKAAIWNGGGMAAFYFFIYAAYALAFSFGTTLINEGHGELNYLFLATANLQAFLPVASAGQVVNVVLAILIGSLSLGLLAPEMQGMGYSLSMNFLS